MNRMHGGTARASRTHLHRVQLDQAAGLEAGGHQDEVSTCETSRGSGSHFSSLSPQLKYMWAESWSLGVMFSDHTSKHKSNTK